MCSSDGLPPRQTVSRAAAAAAESRAVGKSPARRFRALAGTRDREGESPALASPYKYKRSRPLALSAARLVPSPLRARSPGLLSLSPPLGRSLSLRPAAPRVPGVQEAVLGSARDVSRARTGQRIHQVAGGAGSDCARERRPREPLSPRCRRGSEPARRAGTRGTRVHGPAAAGPRSEVCASGAAGNRGAGGHARQVGAGAWPAGCT